jgi:DNA-binding MarR family transcriptional regulator
METGNRQEIVENILELAAKLFRQLLPAVPRELLGMDMTMPQLKIMLILFLNGPVRMSDLAENLGVTLATGTGLVDRLVERGMIERESTPTDRRVVLCHLSESGQKAVTGIWEAAKNRSKELLEAMDTAKLMMFTEVLETMLKSAEYSSATDKIISKQNTAIIKR